MSEKRVNKIFQRQKEFQELCEVNVHTLVASEVNELSEMYLFKAIEEIVELRKTFPSELNKWSKNQGSEQSLEIMCELSDVALFLINFMLVRRIAPTDLLSAIEYVQSINFAKLKTKKMNILNDEMLRTPNKEVVLGSGGLSPDAIFVFFRPILDENHIEIQAEFLSNALKAGGRFSENFYFTYIIKEPDQDSIDFNTLLNFWMPFLKRELEILKKGISVILHAAGTRTYITLSREKFSGQNFQILKDPMEAINEHIGPEEYYTKYLKPFLPKENTNGND